MEDYLRGAVRESRSMIERGSTQDDVIRYLRDQGVSITDSIILLREIYNISLGGAKAAVTAHPVWHSTVEANRELHDLAIQVLNESDSLLDLES